MTEPIYVKVEKSNDDVIIPTLSYEELESNRNEQNERESNDMYCDCMKKSDNVRAYVHTSREFCEKALEERVLTSYKAGFRQFRTAFSRKKNETMHEYHHLFYFRDAYRREPRSDSWPIYYHGDPDIVEYKFGEDTVNSVLENLHILGLTNAYMWYDSEHQRTINFGSNIGMCNAPFHVWINHQPRYIRWPINTMGLLLFLSFIAVFVILFIVMFKTCPFLQ